LYCSFSIASIKLRYIVLFALALIVEPVCGDTRDKGLDYGIKKDSRSSGTTTNPHRKLAPSTLSPINKLCFTELAAIWWSWYYCHYADFSRVKNSCPVQDARVPAKTTFLFYDVAQNCANFATNERTCNIPADHWIILQVAGFATLSDFVSVSADFDNSADTPEGIKMSTIKSTNALKKVTAKIDGVDQFVPRYESQDLCSLEIATLKGCTSFASLDGWEIFSDAYWLRISPLSAGNHTIEVSNNGPDGCSGTKYIIKTTAA
jgi:hypothetical protein